MDQDYAKPAYLGMMPPKLDVGKEIESKKVISKLSTPSH